MRVNSGVYPSTSVKTFTVVFFQGFGKFDKAVGAGAAGMNNTFWNSLDRNESDCFTQNEIFQQRAIIISSAALSAISNR